MPTKLVDFKPFADFKEYIKCLFGYMPCMAINADASGKIQKAAWTFIKSLTTKEAFRCNDKKYYFNMPQFYINKELSKSTMYEYYAVYIEKEIIYQRYKKTLGILESYVLGHRQGAEKDGGLKLSVISQDGMTCIRQIVAYGRFHRRLC